MPNTHGPISADYTEMMNFLAKTLDDAFNQGLKGTERKVGFALLVFPFGLTLAFSPATFVTLGFRGMSGGNVRCEELPR